MLSFRGLVVFALVVAIAGVAAYNRFPEFPAEIALAAIFTFFGCITLSSSVETVFLRNRVKNLERGLHTLEHEFNSRLDSQVANSADQQEFEELKSLLVKKSSGTTNMLVNGSANPIVRQHADNENKPCASSQHEPDIKPADTAKIHMQLQPVVDLANSTTLGFQLIAGHKPNDSAAFEPISKVNGSKPDMSSLARMDLEILTQSLRMARDVRKKAPDALLFIPTTGAFLTNKRTLKSFKQELSANQALSNHCVVGIDGGLWKYLAKTRQSALVDILDLGFETAMSNSPMFSELKQSTNLEHLSFCFIPVSSLGVSTDEVTINPAKDLYKMSEEHGFRIIVSQIENDHEVIRLVDENFQYAVGEFISPARAPNFA